MKRTTVRIFMNAAVAVALAGLTACSGGGSATPKEEGHHHDEERPTEVEVSEKQMQTVGITVGTVDRRYLGDALRVSGELAVNPQDVADVSPMAAGIVRRIAVTEGQQVAAGQTVALVENTEVVTLQQDYLTAVNESALAGKELARQEALASQGAGVVKNLQEARSAAKNAKLRVSGLATRLRQYGISVAESSSSNFTTDMAVKAPIGGTVTRIGATTGGYADPASPILTIVNNRGVYARLNVFERDLSKVKRGEHVELQITNQPGVTLRGTVSEITEALDPASKAASVRVRIEDAAGHTLIPGMTVTAFISLDSRAVDAVPEGAVASIEGKNYIFVLEAEHQEEDGTKAFVFNRTEVTTGTREAGYVEITPAKPLAEGTKIVTDNVFYLASMTADHGEHNH